LCAVLHFRTDLWGAPAHPPSIRGGSDLVAIVQALDEAVLLNCTGGQGATVFNVQAVYAVV
jgi:hypothetical protein